ncbi:MAG TPA: hypothetical protein VMV49_11080 [Candidatus Deferrimicrobium sp.]|nr:hypothetical protein [Candidatus Deferrimicrobium sp.]
MLQGLNKKHAFFGATIFLLISVLLLPAVMGTGGTSRSDAPAYSTGTYYNETFLLGSSAYYNVSGKVEANLTVIVTASTPFDLVIFAPNGVVVATSTGVGTIWNSTLLASKNNYTIAVGDNAVLNKNGLVYFNLTILLIGGKNEGVPAFTIFTAVFSLITLLGIIILYQNRKLYLTI